MEGQMPSVYGEASQVDSEVCSMGLDLPWDINSHDAVSVLVMGWLRARTLEPEKPGFKS